MDRLILCGDRLLLTMLKPPDEVEGPAIPEEARERPQLARVTQGQVEPVRK